MGHINNGSHYKNPRKPKVWTSAHVPLGEDIRIKNLVIEKWQTLGRRPVKRDFTIHDYRKIFSYFKKFSLLIKELDREWVHIRFWREKSEEHKKLVSKKNIDNWNKEHKEYKRELSRKAMRKFLATERGRKLSRKWAVKSYYKNRKSKKCPDCNGKIILKESPRCRSCTMIIRGKVSREMVKSCNQCGVILIKGDNWGANPALLCKIHYNEKRYARVLSKRLLEK